jgi:hypothetical protein
MANSQVPWGIEALNGAISTPAWKTKPSWYLTATDDKMIPPAAQRAMSKRAGSTVVEVAGSHAVYVSQPEAVAALIAKAARGVKLAASKTGENTAVGGLLRGSMPAAPKGFTTQLLTSSLPCPVQGSLSKNI